MSEDHTDEPIQTDKLMQIVTPLISGTVLAMLVSAIVAKAKALSATNSKKSSAAGDVETHPTKESANLEESKAAGVKTNAAGAEDESSGQKGELKGNDTDASGATEDAKAAGAGAIASNTKAGASDVETKGLKMMS